MTPGDRVGWSEGKGKRTRECTGVVLDPPSEDDPRVLVDATPTDATSGRLVLVPAGELAGTE